MSERVVVPFKPPKVTLYSNPRRRVVQGRSSIREPGVYLLYKVEGHKVYHLKPDFAEIQASVASSQGNYAANSRPEEFEEGPQGELTSVWYLPTKNVARGDDLDHGGIVYESGLGIAGSWREGIFFFIVDTIFSLFSRSRRDKSSRNVSTRNTIENRINE